MEKALHISVFPIQEHAVILPRLHPFLKGNHSGSPAGEINLKRIKQKQYIPGQEQHPFPNAPRHRGHGNEEFVK